MEPIERYYHRLDQATAREAFLEKEMLNSETNHLEARTGYFDKLAVLGAGSIAVGITFLTSGGVQSGQLNKEIHIYFWWPLAALTALLLSLIFCVLHNYLASRAVRLLSTQLETGYLAANVYKKWCQETPLGLQIGNDPAAAEIQGLENMAKTILRKRLALIRAAESIGICAVCLLSAGYATGLIGVLLVVHGTA